MAGYSPEIVPITPMIPNIISRIVGVIETEISLKCLENPFKIRLFTRGSTVKKEIIITM